MCVCAKLNIEAACVCVRACLWYMYIHVSTVYTSFSAKWSPGGRTPTASRRRFSCRRSAIGTAQTHPWGCRRNTIINMALCVYFFLTMMAAAHVIPCGICLHKDRWLCIQMYRCTCVHTYVYMYIQRMYVYIYIYTVYVYTVCVYVCTCVCTNIYVECLSIIHAFMHVCMYVCVYVCTYVHMYVCTCVRM